LKKIETQQNQKLKKIALKQPKLKIVQIVEGLQTVTSTLIGAIALKTV